MQNNPQISIILPVDNRRRFLRAAIESIYAQTFKNWELIIVNDGAPPLSSGIRKDNRCRYFRLKKSGISGALNFGIRNSRGNYIARMDADDVAAPDRLYLQLKYLRQHPQVGVLASAVEKIDRRGKSLGIEIMPRNLERAFRFGNPFRHPSVIFRKSLVYKYGGYDMDLDGAEDYDLWMRYRRHTRMAVLPQPLLKYRIHSGSISFTDIGRVEKAFSAAVLKAVFVYGYPKIYLVTALKSWLSARMPVGLKKIIYRRMWNYK